MWEKIQKNCALLFSAGFAIIWSMVLWQITCTWDQSKRIVLLALVLAGVLSVLLLIFYKTGKKTRLWEKENFWNIIAMILLVGIASGLLYAGLSLRVYPSWDFGAVYEGAVQIAEDGVLSPQSNWYFTTYPNNVALCLFLACFFKVCGGLCSYITLGVLLNAFLMTLGFLFFFLLVRGMYGSRWGCLGLLCCACFAPFYMHAPIFYTDTFALPFVTGTFLLYQLRKKHWGFLAGAALVLGVGYKVKGSLGVILIALLIHLWLQKGKVKEQLRNTVLLLLPFLTVVSILGSLPGRVPFMDNTDAEKNEFPIEHWLALGIDGCGGYSHEIYQMTVSVEGKENKKAVDRAFIQKELTSYGAVGMKEHLKSKLQFTWGDGVYFAPEKLKRDPLEETSLHQWTLYDGAEYPKTCRYCNSVQFLLLFGILASLLHSLWKKGEVREETAVQLAVFGLFLFLMIWETRSRYLINFVPMFILLGLDGVRGALDGMACRRKNRRED